MDIRIKSTDYEMPAEISGYLDERIAHIEKLLGSEAELTRCEVEIGRDAGNQRHGTNMWFAEFQVKHPGGYFLRATNRSESVNGAIDDAKAEIERQIRSEKRVHMRLLRKSGAFAKRLMRRE